MKKLPNFFSGRIFGFCTLKDNKKCVSNIKICILDFDNAVYCPHYPHCQQSVVRTVSNQMAFQRAGIRRFPLTASQSCGSIITWKNLVTLAAKNIENLGIVLEDLFGNEGLFLRIVEFGRRNTKQKRL